MASVRDLKKVGFSTREALAIGDESGYYSAAGTTGADATVTNTSIIWVNGSSSANAGVALPSIDKSKSKRHLVMNDTVANIRVYVKHGSGELMKAFGGGGSGGISGGDTYQVIPAGEWREIIKMDDFFGTDAVWIVLT